MRKVPGPDGVSNWIMKECGNQLAGKLHSIIESSLKESRVPLDWKRANIMPIHEGGDKDEPLTLSLRASLKLINTSMRSIFEEKKKKKKKKKKILFFVFVSQFIQLCFLNTNI